MRRRQRVEKEYHKRIWYSFILAVCLAGPVAVAEEAERVVFVPYVDAGTGAIEEGGRTVWTGWQSRLTLFNNGPAPATWRFVAAYGGETSLEGSTDPYCKPTTVHTVEASTGVSVGSCFVRPPTGGVAFVVLGTRGPLVPHPTVRRTHSVADCTSPGVLNIPQGRVPAPTFGALFPSGSVVVTGDVDLGNTELEGCVSDSQRYARRVNVTMFNAGDAQAWFRIMVRAGVNSSRTYYEKTLAVPAKEVVQLNSLPLDLDLVAEQPGAAADGSTTVWVLVTADQPFLSYVSTVFDKAEADAMPMEVYPSYLLP